jgi:hypothetical protein
MIKATNPKTGKWFLDKGQTEPTNHIKIRASSKKHGQNVSGRGGLTFGK